MKALEEGLQEVKVLFLENNKALKNVSTMLVTHHEFLEEDLEEFKLVAQQMRRSCPQRLEASPWSPSPSALCSRGHRSLIGHLAHRSLCLTALALGRSASALSVRESYGSINLLINEFGVLSLPNKLQPGLADHDNYHEYCRLLGRFKANYQSEPAEEDLSPAKVKKWAIDDLKETIAWLESQEERPDTSDVKKIASEGILTCLQDAIESLEHNKHPKELLEGVPGDGTCHMVVFSGLEVMENQLD
ncbi:hypothetical protein Scep_025787 [Stephania cephalantha]|uniref:Uncharacterized protein n=1 Tax=Stephania cephalantha TaxID=152367 RepID=A0AAP0HML8_9MAGN